MICKWCGEPLKAGARTCRRCRQEIPALSDCGGFYDLVQESAPVAPPIPKVPPVEEAPIRPVLPERKKSSPLLGVICCAAIAAALVLLVMNVSLSGKLTEAGEEIDRLRSQLEAEEETTVTDPAAPIINGLEQKDPEPTEEADEILIKLKDGAGEITLSAAQNSQLKSETLHFAVIPEGGEDPVLTFTLQRQKEETLSLRITQTDGVSLYSVQWHSSALEEIPSDEEDGLGFGELFTSSDAITEFDQPIEELAEGKNTCTLTAEDANGEKLTITIYGIVID